MTTRAVLSIGGNVGDSLARLREVADAAHADGILRAASSVYATPPWGGVDQADFLNAALVVVHPGTPRDVLEWGLARERAADRTRVVRWGPRTLDVDVVAAWSGAGAVPNVPGVPEGDDDEPVTSDDPVLTLPHPRAHERAFVLVPWAEIEPDARLRGRPVAEWLADLDPAEVAAVRRTGDELLPSGGAPAPGAAIYPADGA